MEGEGRKSKLRVSQSTTGKWNKTRRRSPTGKTKGGRRGWLKSLKPKDTKNRERGDARGTQSVPFTCKMDCEIEFCYLFAREQM